jgi:hypothetical protein
MPLRPAEQYWKHAQKYAKVARNTADPQIREICIKNEKRFKALAKLSLSVNKAKGTA